MAKPVPFTVAHFRAWASKIILDTSKPWILEKFQADFLKDVFAGYSECWLIVPEGNAKTTLIAGLVLYHIDFMEAGNVPVAASSRDQAAVLYRQSEGMVERSEFLHHDGRFVCQEGYKRIKNENTLGRIQILASDEKTGDGVIPSFAVCDELHRHKNLKLYRTWRGKLKKRPGAQLITISTAGEPGSEFETVREAIRESATEVKTKGSSTRYTAPGIVMHEWAVPPKADVKDCRVVKAANPLKAITVKGLREDFGSPTMTIDHWKRFKCNIATRSGKSAITDAEWRAMITDMTIPEGEVIWAGVDFGWKWDTTAIVPLWIADEEHRLLGPASILVPPRDGTSLAVSDVKRAFVLINERNPIEVVVADMSRGEDVCDWIRDELGADVVDRPQGNKFGVAEYNDWMEAARNEWLFHTGDEGLKQHALNAVTKALPGGDTRFERPKQARNTSHQDRRVIDALKAAAMVHSAYVATLEDEEKETPSWRPM